MIKDKTMNKQKKKTEEESTSNSQFKKEENEENEGIKRRTVDCLLCLLSLFFISQLFHRNLSNINEGRACFVQERRGSLENRENNHSLQITLLTALTRSSSCCFQDKEEMKGHARSGMILYRQ
jgi:hypothetical protein